MARPPIANPRSIRGLFHYTYRWLNNLNNRIDAVVPGVPEAPEDGNQYARKNAVWDVVSGFLQNVVEDTTPELGGTLDALKNDITGVRSIAIDGQAAVYATDPGPFINVSADHSYSYPIVFGPFVGTSIPAVLSWQGVHTLEINGFPFGMGSAFSVQGKIRNDPAVAVNFGPFYVLVDQITFEADSQPVTMNTGIDMLVSPSFNASNAGSLTVTNYNHISLGMSIASASVSMGTRQGVVIADATGAGTLTSQAAVVVAPLVKAASNTAILTGTTTVPAGNWNIYQASTLPNRWRGGHLYWTRISAATTVTITTTDTTVRLSSTAAVTCTLPSATSCKGFRVAIKKTGASGTISIKSVSNQTADGVNITSGSIALSTQWSIVELESDGANWIIWKNGAP
jgi:hypothetical protein